MKQAWKDAHWEEDLQKAFEEDKEMAEKVKGFLTFLDIIWEIFCIFAHETLIITNNLYKETFLSTIPPDKRECDGDTEGVFVI